MNAYGLVPKVFNKIKEAKTPDRFTQDFLGTVLGFQGGSARAFIPVAKRLGFLNSDGSPTEIYKRFRNPDLSKRAMADAIRRGYPTLFARNQYADRLDKKKLEGLVTEATGLDASAPTLRSIVGTFEALRQFADFDAAEPPGAPLETEPSVETGQPVLNAPDQELRFSYTINLNLPNTNDISVFNAIFKSLRDHLLAK